MMDESASEYRKLAIKQFPPRILKETPEGRYWRSFRAPVVVKQFGAVTHIDFCPVEPYSLAVTSSTRVLLYDSKTRQEKRQITRFKDKAYSGCYRGDGKLIVAGGEMGIVQVFDAGSRTLLRQLTGHSKPVHATRFAADKLHVVSAGDDATVRVWDMAVGSQLRRYDGHTDYVRAAAASSASIDTWATGGYDHACKIWDMRTATAVMSIDHGAPIEDVLFFPSGAMVVTCGGTSVCVWDVLSGGRLVRRLTNHQKTVTCVRLSPMAGPQSTAAPRLLSGSLDCHVKVFELNQYKVAHAQKYPSPIMSLGLAPDCSLLAVGMADGTLSMRQHSRPRAAAAGAVVPKSKARRYRLTALSYRYFIRGQDEKASEGDFVVAARHRVRLRAYDRFLRKFRYGAALDAALESNDIDVVVSVIEELAARNGIDAALRDRDAASLQPLLRTICRHIADPRHTRTLAALAHRLLDAYSSQVGIDKDTSTKLKELYDRLCVELKLQDSLQVLQGSLEPILACSIRH